MDPASANVARTLTDAAARFRLRAEVGNSACLVIRDPSNEALEFALFILTSDGRVYTFGPTAPTTAGYPAELSETYRATLTDLAGPFSR